MIGCSLRGFPALRLAGFPPYEEIASVQFLMKSSSLHPCNKCGLYPARLHADSRWSFPHLLHRLIWCMRLTKVCRWENIFFNCVCFSHKQDQNYLLFLWLHIEPCTITTVGQIQVQRDTSATGKHWRGLMCLPGSGRWCPTASAVQLTDFFMNQFYQLSLKSENLYVKVHLSCMMYEPVGPASEDHLADLEGSGTAK